MTTKPVSERMRVMAGALAVFVICAVETELFLLKHIEEWRQILPIVMLALGAVLLVTQLIRPSARGVMAVRVLMILLIATGALGVVFHFQGNLVFQMEIDATQHGWPLIQKVLQAKAPPALAPGALAEIGLLGLLYTYRHPSLE
jgi:hypothetical protein